MKMRILHVSNLSQGGAFNAAHRLHLGLLESGEDSMFLTLAPGRENLSSEISFPRFSKYGFTLRNRILNKLGWRKLVSFVRESDYQTINHKIECFSSPFTDFMLAEYINIVIKPDIINLHWTANFLDYKEFFSKINVPIVWTLHDMAPFSSYWHYDSDFVQSEPSIAIHKKYLAIKAEALEVFNYPLAVVAPSSWLCNASKSSKVFSSFPHHHIPYGIDTKIFQYTTLIPEILKDLELKQGKLRLMFICQSIANKRKGLSLLTEALKIIPENKFQLIAVGERNMAMEQKLPQGTIFTGSISSELELARVYSLCDAMVIPSLQDNLPNTLIEALCCGTPVIGTPVGGINEVLQNKDWGLLASATTSDALAEAIMTFGREHNRFKRSQIQVEASELFTLSKQAMSYKALYHSLLYQSIEN